jgi:excisionase family DNA binding protein
MSLKRRTQAIDAATEQTPRPVDSPYLTSEEARVYLRLGSESALYRLIREHRLPVCRRGRLYLFDRRELDAWARGFDSALTLARHTRKAS